MRNKFELNLGSTSFIWLNIIYKYFFILCCYLYSLLTWHQNINSFNVSSLFFKSKSYPVSESMPGQIIVYSCRCARQGFVEMNCGSRCKVYGLINGMGYTGQIILLPFSSPPPSPNKNKVWENQTCIQMAKR